MLHRLVEHPREKNVLSISNGRITRLSFLLIFILNFQSQMFIWLS